MTIFKQRLRHHRKKKEFTITSLYGSCWHVASHVLVEKEKWNCGNVKREIRTWEKQKEEKKSEVKRKKKRKKAEEKEITQRGSLPCDQNPIIVNPFPPPPLPSCRQGGGLKTSRHYASMSPPRRRYVPFLLWPDGSGRGVIVWPWLSFWLWGGSILLPRIMHARRSCMRNESYRGRSSGILIASCHRLCAHSGHAVVQFMRSCGAAVVLALSAPRPATSHQGCSLRLSRLISGQISWSFMLNQLCVFSRACVCVFYYVVGVCVFA